MKFIVLVKQKHKESHKVPKTIMHNLLKSETALYWSFHVVMFFGPETGGQ